MNIAVIGTGYVGLVSGVCFSELGHNVTCIDIDKSKIEMLNRLELPIFEPGLKEMIANNLTIGNLKFSCEFSESLKQSEIIIISVGTPSLPNGEANLTNVEKVATDIANSMEGYKIIIIKSTVPVGTNEKVKRLISSMTKHSFDVVSVPEFLREGSAIKDTFNPDRIIIGTDSNNAEKSIVELHKPFTDNILVTDIRSAEMIKYASNAFLATKISFINEIANICEKVGADIQLVAKGMGQDKRIGGLFLNAGIGYGGSCFPKDTDALIQIAGNENYEFKLLKAVVDVNNGQRLNIINKLINTLGNVNDKIIGIWGLSFKANTDDVREAPSIEIVNLLIKMGAIIKLYDPIAMSKFKAIVNHDSLIWCDSAMDTVLNCDALCLLTEWDEFKSIDLTKVERLMRQPILIDGRNVYSKEQINKTNLEYYSIGRPSLTRKHERI